MKVLINRSDAIGDTLLTLPVARRIKEKNPDAKVYFLISSASKDLFRYYPDVDGHFVFDRKHTWTKTFVRMIRLFFKEKFDTYLFVGGSHIPTYAAWLTRVRFRGGLRSKWQSFFFLNKAVRQRRSIVEMHETDYNLNLLDPLGMNYHYTERYKYKPQLTLPSDDVEHAYLKFCKDLEGKVEDPTLPMIFIHPGMTGHTLNWSPRNYARLVAKMERRWPGQYLYIISHTSSDAVYIESFRELIKREKWDFLNRKIFYFDGRLQGLAHYLLILKKAKLFIGPSTGNTHMANALNVSQIAIYSPIKVQSLLRWGPFDRSEERCQVIIPDAVCGERFECAGERCIYYQCMAKIEVDDVVAAAEKLLFPAIN